MKTQEEKRAMVQAVLDTKNACRELREVCRLWLAAEGGKDEAYMSKLLIKELGEDVMPIHKVIKFMDTDAGKKIFGEEGAAKAKVKLQAAKDNGAEWCPCPACTAGKAILDAKDDFLIERP